MTYNGEEIGIPEVWQIAEYIALKGFNLRAQDVYDKYEAQGWVKSNGGEIQSLEAIVNAQNGVMLQKKRKDEKKKEKKKRKAEKQAPKKQRQKESLEKSQRDKKQRKERVEVVKKTKENFIPYDKQLKDKRWRLFRKEVIEEKGNKCEMCGRSSNLCVHHKVYIKGRYAWEYPKRHLMVLCRECHEKIHGIDLNKRMSELIDREL